MAASRILDFSSIGRSVHRRPSPQRGEREEAPQRPLTHEERAAVDNYINYRLKLAAHPLATASGPSAVPYSATVRDASDGVLRAELRMLELKTDDVEDELEATILEHEAARIALSRLREATAIERMKLSSTQAFIAKARDVVLEASKRAGKSAAAHEKARATAAAGATPSTSVFASLMESETDGSAGGNNGILHTSAELTLRRARLQDALSNACDVCPTVVYPTLMESLSSLAQIRRRVDYEKKWSDDVRHQLERIQREMSVLRAEEEARTNQITSSKEELDEIYREVFTKRKGYILTHKRLAGLDRLPNGAVLSEEQAAPVLDAIRGELRVGKIDTLERLAATDCAELMSETRGAAGQRHPRYNGDSAAQRHGNNGSAHIDALATPRATSGSVVQRATGSLASSFLTGRR